TGRAGHLRRVRDRRARPGWLHGDVGGVAPEHPPRALTELTDQHGGHGPVRGGTDLDLTGALVALAQLTDDRVDEAEEVGRERVGGRDRVLEAAARPLVGPQDLKSTRLNSS